MAPIEKYPTVSRSISRFCENIERKYPHALAHVVVAVSLNDDSTFEVHGGELENLEKILSSPSTLFCGVATLVRDIEFNDGYAHVVRLNPFPSERLSIAECADILFSAMERQLLEATVSFKVYEATGPC